MRRRDFITGMTGYVALWPKAAAGQRPDQMRRIGVLTTANKNDPEIKTRLEALFRELERQGWSENRNLRVELRESAGDISRTRRFAAELAALKPDVILAMGSLPAASLLEATRTVPVLFALVIDPVGAGLVKTLARPGAMPRASAGSARS